MALAVLNVAFPYAPVGPRAVGGAEQILSDLDHALVEAGHRSLVVACKGSQTAGELFEVPMPESQSLDQAAQQASWQPVQSAIERALRTRRVDIVHIHAMNFYEYTVPAQIPVLVTLHLPIAWYPREAWRDRRDSWRFCCVSESQRRSCPAELSDCFVVENGVDLPHYEARARREDFALVLGRICPEKNAHAALEAGTVAGMRVLIGGRVYPYSEHQRYFRERIEPLLRQSGAGHEFLGVADPVRRRNLLARAKCLLHPTLAPETSSLVAMEALAAGTPVIAYCSGALEEIVEDGVTGFLVNSVAEMAQAIGNLHRISSVACRRSAEQRFCKQHMLRNYFRLYANLLCPRPAEKLYA